MRLKAAAEAVLILVLMDNQNTHGWGMSVRKVLLS